MSWRPEENAPLQVISLTPTPLDEMNIEREQDILWPCLAFSISIPQKKKNNLDIFEETVLRLSQLEPGGTAAIAELTCLELDLVFFIQNRLHHLGLLDERHFISIKGSALMDDWENPPPGDDEYVTATVFMDQFSRKLLSYLHTSRLEYSKVVSHEGTLVSFFRKPADDRPVRARLIRYQAAERKTPPRADEIIRAVKNYSQSFQRWALRRPPTALAPPSIPGAEAVTVHPMPESVHLHCQVLRQKGHSGFSVTDGYGLGFSDDFARYLKGKEWSWLDELKKAVDLETPAAYMKYTYPRITLKMRYVEGYGKKMEISPEITPADRREIAGGLYAALERAFGECYARYLVPEWEKVFASQDYADNEKVLRELAAKIGFSVPSDRLAPGQASILQVKPGAIRRVARGRVMLPPLLALLIAGASKFDRHPFHDLAAYDRDFLDFLRRLKRWRDPDEPDEEKPGQDPAEFKMDSAELGAHIGKVREILRFLLPSIGPELEHARRHALAPGREK